MQMQMLVLQHHQHCQYKPMGTLRRSLANVMSPMQGPLQDPLQDPVQDPVQDRSVPLLTVRARATLIAVVSQRNRMPLRMDASWKQRLLTLL